MKRYVRSDTMSKQNIRCNEDDEYISFDAWRNNFRGRGAFDKFCTELEKEVRQTFDVTQYSFTRPKSYYRLEIYLDDGSHYEFELDWLYLHGSLYDDGVYPTLYYYFNKIKKGIESGSASGVTLMLR